MSIATLRVLVLDDNRDGADALGLTRAECQLAKPSMPEDGWHLIKRVRKQLLEVARPMLESMVHEVTGIRAESMHHDICTVTGKEVVLFRLARAPRFEPGRTLSS